jgi:hypothetical protein
MDGRIMPNAINQPFLELIRYQLSALVAIARDIGSDFIVMSQYEHQAAEKAAADLSDPAFNRQEALETMNRFASGCRDNWLRGKVPENVASSDQPLVGEARELLKSFSENAAQLLSNAENLDAKAVADVLGLLYEEAHRLSAIGAKIKR